MSQFTKQAGVVLTVSVIAITTGGCLTKEDSASRFAGNEPIGQNNPPTISGSPPDAVMTGDTYSFTPTASDSDGDTLTFSVENLPSWASFDTSTGEISGQPALGDVGVFSGVVVSVSDGNAKTSLPSYSITVSQAALGSVTVSWTPPTENTDGSALTNLSGYRIYYGPSEGNYPNKIDINTAGIASYVVENLLPDTYYIVATSVNSAGVESAFSNMTIKTVDGG